MKRIHKLFILAALAIATLLILSGCGSENQVNPNELQHASGPEDRVDPNGLQLVSSYELIAAKVESQTQISGSLSGAYLFCIGGMSGNIETTTTPVYKYWYQREDGGIIPACIDMSSYYLPETVIIVIYEDDSVTPKVEIWRNPTAQRAGDGGFNAMTEFRFTIPSGSFVNTYDLQGLTEDSQ